jgi:hypothetical protein
MISLIFLFIISSIQDSALTIKVNNNTITPKDSLLFVNVHLLNSTDKKLKIIELHSTGRKEICSEPGWSILINHRDICTAENVEYNVVYAFCSPSQVILAKNEEYNVGIFINFRYLYNKYSKHWPNINRDYGEYEIQLKLSTQNGDTLVSNKLKILYEDKN